MMIGWLSIVWNVVMSPAIAQMPAQNWRNAPTQNQASAPLSGKVLETQDAATYTYLKLKTASGEEWAAIPQAKVAVGSDVQIQNPLLMSNFESKTLKRTFAKIYFGNLASGGGNSGSASTAGKSAPNSYKPVNSGKNLGTHLHAGATEEKVQLSDYKTPKAEGANARTVAELFEQKDSLKGKKATVRAKVAKVALGVMGKNWIHLRDGTGQTDKNNFDLTVTTKAEGPSAGKAPQVGDTVTLTGTVAADKDIGAGYFYPVLLEVE